MITINLLPDEYRRKAKSPIGMIAAVAAAVLVNTSLFAYYGYLEFGTSAERRGVADDARLIVEHPGAEEDGAYSLETTHQLDVDSALSLLAQHPDLQSDDVRSLRSATQQAPAASTSAGKAAAAASQRHVDAKDLST